MINVIRANYATYVNTALMKQERHWWRFFVMLAVSLAAALFAPGNLSNAFSMMATGVTVLTGFTFTALFSNHALAASDLPKPKNENDIHDVGRLQILSNNFRERSSYFITISIIEIVLLAAASFTLSGNGTSAPFIASMQWWETVSSQNIIRSINELGPVLSVAFVTFVTFLYLECLYTFYRMAETILSVLDIRRNYLSPGANADG